MKKLIVIVTVLAALGAFYWYAAVDGRMPADATYELDMAEVRRLADTIPGYKPAQIRYEKILSFEFAEAMVMAGAPWKATEIPVYAYQLIFPESTLMIDAAMPREMVQPKFMAPFYDDAAWLRMLTALEISSQIVITHEHMDHIGGVTAHPNLPKLLPRLRLTATQLAHPGKMKPAEFPSGALDGYTPLQTSRYHALAPGVVLIAAPGHTPGSHLVYVQRGDGEEYLFLGDALWQMRNIEQQIERPRFMTWLIGEDRHAVFGQIRTLHALRQLEPRLHIVPGHDAGVIAQLTLDGMLEQGYSLP